MNAALKQETNPGPLAAEPAREFAAASLLCAAAGFADAIGYLASGVFAANMTGNTVLGAMSLAEGNFGLAAERFATLLAFFAGALLARFVLHWKSFSISWALTIEFAILLLACFGSHSAFVTLEIVAFAMGVQAAAMTKFVGAQVSTVVVTSTLARIAESVADRMAHRFGAPRRAAPHNVSLLGATWLFYAVGAAIAVGARRWVPGADAVLVLPAAAVLGVAWLMRATGARQPA